MHKITQESRNYKKCIICYKRRLRGSNVHLFRIPLHPDRCKKWLKAIGQEDLVYLPLEKLHELKFVCNEHFQRDDFNESRTRLLKHAVPTLNLRLKALEEKMFYDFPLYIGQYPKKHVLQDKTNLDSGPKTGPVAKKKYDIIDVLQDKTNLDSGPKTGPVAKKKYDIIDSLEVPGPSCAVINVQSHIRKRKSAENKGLNAREEKLLLKLKSQKQTLQKLAKTSLDLDKLNGTALKNLVSDVAKNHQKKPQGKRWTMRTKLWALAIFKRSPKAYRYLQWAMSVPSEKTLQRLLQSVPLKPGINKNLILKCSDMLSGLTDQDKFCALLFDEMALKKRLIYNEANDKIEGFEDYGDERNCKIADHALVFMVQGLKKKFKLPVAYFFVQGTISSAKLSVLIKNVIITLEEVGFNILTTVCDQGPTNVGALSLLKKFGGQFPEDNYFIFNECKKVFILFDIPHLFKSIRNNFYNAGEIVWGGKTGKWSHLIEAEERNRNFLNFPKLNRNVVHPTYKAKMRVKYAAHALSNTMSAILHMLAWKHDTAENEISETAYIIKELDKLFDICNGPSSPKDVKKNIRENVSSKTNHVETWQYFLATIDSIKFVKSNSKLQLSHVRCIKGFKTSLKSLGDIWSVLRNEGFKYLNLRQLNQDSLENLFGMIRQHSVTNKNPTCTHFTAALKTSILSGLLAPHSRGSNCEEDANSFFFNYDNLNSILNEEIETTAGVESSEHVPVLSLPDEVEDIMDINLCNFEDQPVVYVSGYLASKLLRESDCIDCKKSLISERPDNDVFKYISLREWFKDKKSLTYPSIGLCQTVNKAKTIFESFEGHYKNDLIKICILEYTVHCDFTWFTCIKHLDLRHTLLKQLSLLFINKYCKITNDKFSAVENETADNYKKAQIQSKA